MSEGLRYDQGKTRWDLLPFDALNEVAKVSTLGAQKYAERNWEKGMAWSKMVASAMRHLFYRMAGERLDPETNLPHLAHFAWNALSLLAYELRDIGENDIEECVRGPAREYRVSRDVLDPAVTYTQPPRGEQVTTHIDVPYEGVTREEDRLGCSFLRFLPEFGAKK